ncbi:DoxX family protein [Candidatus Peregrinibacteria bacterium]|nr:DoxX family protein [Candidatus Peregrinibacteria bacterium]
MKDSQGGCKCAQASSWIMRLVLALVFLNASYMKIFIFTVPGFAQSMGLPEIVAWLIALGELGAGIGIIVGKLIASQDAKGMLTRLSGGIIALIMLGAIILVKSKGFGDGFPQGIAGMYADLALFALGMNFALMGNVGGHCGLCEK